MDFAIIDKNSNPDDHVRATSARAARSNLGRLINDLAKLNRIASHPNSQGGMVPNIVASSAPEREPFPSDSGQVFASSQPR